MLLLRGKTSAENNKKPLQLVYIASALKNIAPESIIHTAVAKPEVDFFIDSTKKSSKEDKNFDCVSVDDLLLMSQSKADFFQHLQDNMTPKNLKDIEKLTQGQSDNENWFQFRKGVISGSKAHAVSARMKKVRKPTGGFVDMYSLKEKVSGRTFTNPNIPALKYSRDMESEALSTFETEIKKEHKHVKIQKCGFN